MLDADCSFQVCPPDTRIWWGAYLGTDDELLVAGTVGEVGAAHRGAACRARARHGWIMDTYLLRAADWTLPELPEIEALADHLRRHAVGQTIGRVDVAAFSVLKTFDPPITALHGQTVDRRRPVGQVPRPAGRGSVPDHPPVAGRLAALVRQAGRGAAEAGQGADRAARAPGHARRRRRASTSPRPAPRSGWRCGWSTTRAKVPGIAALGPDALELSPEDLAGLLAGNSGRIKTVITDQKVIAGIGNAYSDEILHVAKISPFATAGKLSGASSPRCTTRWSPC